MRRCAHLALGLASASALALCGLALATGLVVIVATVRAHEWLERCETGTELAE